MATKILITAGTSKTGSATIKDLVKLNKGYHIVAGTRDVHKNKDSLLAIGANEVVHFDVEDPNTFAPALQGIERVFYVHPGSLDNAEKWTKSLAEVVKTVPSVKFIARLSAFQSNPDHKHYAGRNNGLADKALYDTGIDFAGIGPNYFFENWVIWYKNSIKSGTVHGAARDSPVAYVALEDIAAVTAAVLDNPDKYKARLIEITGPAAVSDAQIIQEISKAIGKEVNYVNHSLADFEKLLQSSGLPPEAVLRSVRLEDIKNIGLASNVTDSVEKILGRPPKSLSEWAKEHVRDFA